MIEIFGQYSEKKSHPVADIVGLEEDCYNSKMIVFEKIFNRYNCNFVNIFCKKESQFVTRTVKYLHIPYSVPFPIIETSSG